MNNESSVGPPNGKAPTINRACQNCSRLKAKCIPQTDGVEDRCTRCFRLDKECVTPPRRARKRRPPSHATGVSQLEEKIQSLVSLLAGAKAGMLNPDNPFPTSAQNAGRTDPDRAKVSAASSINGSASSLAALASRETPPIQEPWDPPRPMGIHLDASNCGPAPQPPIEKPLTPDTSTPSTTAPPQPNRQWPFNDRPGPEESWLLNIFRDTYLIHFPFVKIPPETSAEDLWVRRPWVYYAVIMVASQSNRTRQLEMAKHMTTEVATALIIRGEKNLDMLQGLLIHNAWCYNFSPQTPHTQSTAVFQLAHTMIFDLGLNKPVRDTLDGLPDTSKIIPEINLSESRRTSDERRTLLAWFFSSSVISLCLRRMECLQHTPYIDHNCKLLYDSAEYESDLVLVTLVRLQCIVESFQRTLLNESMTPHGSKVPAWMYIKSARAELQDFWTSLCPRLRSNGPLLRAYHSAEVYIYQPSIHPSSHGVSFGTGNAQRLELLYACLISCKTLLDLYLALPLSVYYTVSIVELAEMGHGLTALSRLSLVEQPGWDLAHVRKTVNLLDYFGRLISNFEEVGAAIDQSQPEPCRMSLATGCALAMKRVRAVYEAKVAPESEPQPLQEQPGTAGMNISMNMEQFDWIDDAYWQELSSDMSFLQ
ncbi:uncharacterized protein BP5553_00950 [Venustampulla echinocandica]|uniref:Zn(2)-C6 fungal-type domain-containing protein n=1 Tax=Venustampulla echinocandica TaxID=2656787 RepID=A0A370TZL6_9HELO|nr:uncharacterized protein BP5553_00950 [Venustampulla echinocandica]RDL40971.1 hypothetical protein BP5553_00950 [Venustampulla echinocandica]